jgi:hypothetical protein
MVEENSISEEEVYSDEEAEGETITTIGWVKEMLQRAPWWAASAIFHFIILLAATVIGFATKAPETDKVIEMRVASGKVEPLRFPEKRSIIERKGIPGPQDDTVTDPAIFFPEAEESDHNESADDEDTQQMKGQSFDFISSQTGSAGGIRGNVDSKQQAIYDTLGVGGGGGGAGRYGGRFGGKRNLRARGGGGGTEAAVIAGLRWLARHQDAEGRWSTDKFDQNCGGNPKCSGPGNIKHDVGLTGLALLAFLGAGYLPNTQYRFEDPFHPGRIIRFADTVRNGLRWLKDNQDSEGCFPKQEGEFMYDHAISTLAMCEAAWLVATPLYKEPAQKGIDFLCRAQNPGFAWRYEVRKGDNDTSVTGWCVMALKSAELSGLKFNHEAYAGVKAWLERMTNTKTGVVGYQGPGDAGSFITGVNDKWLNHPAMTAVGLLCKIFVDKKQTPDMKTAVALIVKDLPTYDEEHKTIDFYYWYYAALALFQYDAPNGAGWQAFNVSMKKALVPFQAGYRNTGKVTCTDGSWNPAVDKWGAPGGRVYATAINVLTLEVYYRYANVFGTKKEGGGAADDKGAKK